MKYQVNFIRPRKPQTIIRILSECALPVLLFMFACLSLTSCGNQPKAIQAKAPEIEAKPQQTPHIDREPSFKPQGDFADGTSLGDVLKDMTINETIVEMLDKRNPDINLKELSGYADKPSRDDLMIFKNRDCSFVRTVNLSNYGLSDTDIEGISDLPLTSLALSQNRVKDLHAIKNMKHLIRFEANETPLDKEGFNVLLGLKNLVSLGLKGTPIDDKELESLSTLKSLSYIDVSDCPNLTDRGVEQFQRKSACHIVHGKFLQGGGYTDLMRVQVSLMKDGDYDEADLALQGLIKRWKLLSPVPHPWIVRAYRYRALCQVGLENFGEACKMYDKAIEYAEKSDPNNAELPDIEVSYADLLEKNDKLQEAGAHRKTADQYWKTHPEDVKVAPNYRSNLDWLQKHQ